jgi:hypothetical protein
MRTLTVTIQSKEEKFSGASRHVAATDMWNRLKQLHDDQLIGVHLETANDYTDTRRIETPKSLKERFPDTEFDFVDRGRMCNYVIACNVNGEFKLQKFDDRWAVIDGFYDESLLKGDHWD